jgi:hypothetical protein
MVNIGLKQRTVNQMMKYRPLFFDPLKTRIYALEPVDAAGSIDW